MKLKAELSGSQNDVAQLLTAVEEQRQYIERLKAQVTELQSWTNAVPVTPIERYICDGYGDDDATSDGDFKTILAWLDGMAGWHGHRPGDRPVRYLTEEEQEQTPAYIITCPKCNGMIGAHVDDGDHQKETAAFVARHISLGYAANRSTVGAVRITAWCTCKEAKS